MALANLSTQNNHTVSWPALGLDSTYDYIYYRVLCYLWNYHGDTLKMYSALRLEGLNTITLTLVQTKAFKQHLARWNIPCTILLNPLTRQHDLTTRLGAVAFPVL